jgi:hypothetical protein
MKKQNILSSILPKLIVDKIVSYNYVPFTGSLKTLHELLANPSKRNLLRFKYLGGDILDTRLTHFIHIDLQDWTFVYGYINPGVSSSYSLLNTNLVNIQTNLVNNQSTHANCSIVGDRHNYTHHRATSSILFDNLKNSCSLLSDNLKNYYFKTRTPLEYSSFYLSNDSFINDSSDLDNLYFIVLVPSDDIFLIDPPQSITNTLLSPIYNVATWISQAIWS